MSFIEKMMSMGGGFGMPEEEEGLSAEEYDSYMADLDGSQFGDPEKEGRNQAKTYDEGAGMGAMGMDAMSFEVRAEGNPEEMARDAIIDEMMGADERSRGYQDDVRMQNKESHGAIRKWRRE